MTRQKQEFFDYHPCNSHNHVMEPAYNLDSYKNWLSTFLMPNSVKNRMYYAHRYVNWLSTIDIGSPWDAQHYHVSQFIIHAGKAPSTKKNVRDALVTLYKWGHNTEQTDASPVKSIPKIRVPISMPRPTPFEFIDDALARCRRLSDVIMIVLALYAGLRAVEIASLHTSDFDEDQIRVQGKGDKIRYVPIHDMLKPLITHIPNGWVFPSSKNPTGHYLPASVSQRLSDLLGPGRPGGHSLRHRFATDIFAETHNLILVQELLGHASISTTRIYTRGNTEHLAPAVQALPSRDTVSQATTRTLEDMRQQQKKHDASNN